MMRPLSMNSVPLEVTVTYHAIAFSLEDAQSEDME